MYWGVIDPEGGRPTNNILLQGRLKICYQFIDLLVYKSGASNHVLCAVRCALHVHVSFAWCSLLVAAGARLPADPCCSQRWRLTPRFASSAQAQCAGVAGAAIVAGAVAWSTSPPGPWRALVLWQLFTDFQLHLHPFIGM